ncbi:putative PAS/PAC sensor protein [[Leptolyngbya] sp. PCC 7376]|uniref:SpoIIE family protein phosphatase n=1 Tax=[Leptolyngbya] sp. PCC 7376 TaxID=111781 RepID=UPI00029F3838|nr:SpoIIE family protein phosphatase [[Leptolyngbya] sp. PCC 7376]AFY39814.1 putative PAS/PAC sensor protein [[Leptolyngbya] sp. PCC 7376]
MPDSSPEVLIIDDVRLSRTFLRHVLKQANYRVSEAENGAEGIALFKERSPSLVLVDGLMPEVDGFECCRTIRQLPGGEDIPILMVTSLEDTESVNKAFQAGASDYITKPIHPSVLLGRMRCMLKSLHAMQELRNSEEKYRSLVTSLQEVLFQLTPDGEIIFINPIWYDIMGYSPIETIGAQILNFIHPIEHKRNTAKIQLTSKNKDQCFRYTTRFITKQKEIRWVEVQICGNADPQTGELIRIAGRLYDITERALSEKYRRLEYTVNRILSHSEDIDLAIRRVLQVISGNSETPFAEYWSLDESSQELSSSTYWHLRNDAYNDFSGSSIKFYLKDWMQSVHDITSYIEEIRAEQAVAASKNKSSHPPFDRWRCVQQCVVSHGTQTLGLMVFWNDKKNKMDDTFSMVLEILGKQLGQYLKRKEAEQELKKKNDLLQRELNQAARYVESLLPQPEAQESQHCSVQIDTLFQPSNALGGDVFDYTWLDSDNLMFYVLDVAGHGVKPALLSVSILNILRRQGYSNIDFYEPEIVLTALNRLFQMSESGDDYFSMWYGIYNHSTRVLKYASAGHPQGLLIVADEDNEEHQIKELSTDNIAVGLFSDFPFEAASVEVPLDSHLFIYSDGVYEFFVDKHQEMFGLENWKDLILTYMQSKPATLKSLFQQINHLNYGSTLGDDCSIMEISFG